MYLWSSLLSLISAENQYGVKTSYYEISGKNPISIQIVFLQSIIYPPGKKIHWNKQHFGIIVLCCLPTPFLHLNVLFSFSFYSCIYLRSKISLLIWRLVIITKLKRWYVNLSASHSYFSFGIICGRLWESLAVSETLNTFIHSVAVPSKTIPDSRPKSAKFIPVFKPIRRKNPTR